jgi:hypothetical protein
MLGNDTGLHLADHQLLVDEIVGCNGRTLICILIILPTIPEISSPFWLPSIRLTISVGAVRSPASYKINDREWHEIVYGRSGAADVRE